MGGVASGECVGVDGAREGVVHCCVHRPVRGCLRVGARDSTPHCTHQRGRRPRRRSPQHTVSTSPTRPVNFAPSVGPSTRWPTISIARISFAATCSLTSPTNCAPRYDLQGNTEALVDGVDEPTPAAIGSLHDEVVRLGRLVADLETLAAAEAAGLRLHTVPVDLADIAHTQSRRHRPRLERRRATPSVRAVLARAVSHESARQRNRSRSRRRTRGRPPWHARRRQSSRRRSRVHDHPAVE